MGVEFYALDTPARATWWEAVRFARDAALRASASEPVTATRAMTTRR